MKNHTTRWYQSLTLRLLALFWFLLLAATLAAFTSAFYLTRPPQPEAAGTDFERTLRPILEEVDNYSLLQPGRLLVGEYRVVARKNEGDEGGLEMTQGLSQAVARAALSLIDLENDPLQIAVRGQYVAGPFFMGEARLIISRPMTGEEVAELAARDNQDLLPNLLWMAVAMSGIGALILGVWFVRPLRRLRTATREIAAGSANPNLARLPRRRDELGELARTLRTTAVELATSRDAQRRLLSDVSHELRSPLARLQVALDLLETPELRGSTHWKMLEKDILRLSRIIDSILWLSRLENGISKLEREDVSPAAMLKELESDLIYENDVYRNRIIYPHEGLPTLATDPILLRLIIENLVRNAFQYGPDDGKVLIDAEVTKHHLQLSIHDQGPGVDEATLDQLFVPFFRADPSRHHGAGVGLGLALCLRATAVLSGKLEASNHPDGGLEVRLSLPLKP
ncbi:sensor histidine kinase [Aliidiomarina soli]|uniref:histidine kinase n=1 Tax=Aliidiomarina soli TaxID=1928574 RepID=A0A432WF45_9GAMM|nr:HAMP domain-containing sensor histidine kinase [Aliidiomarina soli]RUO32400.1 sensor histidine kinase [Aliidiomarina soli]